MISSPITNKYNLVLISCFFGAMFWYPSASGQHQGGTCKTYSKITNSEGSQKCIRALFYDKNMRAGSVIRDVDMKADSISTRDFPLETVNYEAIAQNRRVVVSVEKGKLVSLRDFGITAIPSYLPNFEYDSKAGVQVVVLSARSVSKGKVINYDDLVFKIMQVDKIPPHSLVSPYAAIGRSATKDIQKGSIIFLEDVGI